MSFGWQALVLSLCVAGVLLGFALRMGYELRSVRAVLARARYLSIYSYQISLESEFWSLSHTKNSISLMIKGSYPSFRVSLPLIISFDWVSLTYRDESESDEVNDYSKCTLCTPLSDSKSIRIGFWMLELLDPVIKLKQFHGMYAYKKSGEYRDKCLSGSASGMIVEILKKLFSAESVEYSVKDAVGPSFDLEESIRLNAVGRCECQIPNFNEIVLSTESISITYMAGDSLRSYLESLATEFFVPFIPSPQRLKLNLSVRSRIASSLSFRDRTCIQSTVNIASRLSSTRRPSGSLGCLHFQIVADPFSGKLFSGSLHNFAEKGTSGGVRSLNAQIMVRGVTLVSVTCSGNDLLGCFSESGDWSLTARAQQVAVTLLDKTGSTSSSIVLLKAISLTGNPAKGLGVNLSLAEIDISARMLNKAVRVYLRLMSLFELPKLKDDLDDSSVTGQVISLTSVWNPVDPIFHHLQRKLLYGAQSPSILNESSLSTAPIAAAPDAMSRSTSATSLSVDGQERKSNVKNWKAMERIMFDSGNVFISWSIDQMIIRNKDALELKIPKIKVTSKISPTGQPFMTVCCDGFRVNENVEMNGGMRIWVDGHLTSEMSRVFCLIPPISIRFESKFAEAVEAYFLELVEVVKILNSRSTTATSAATTKEFIEFLQISSLQLELHAKEMLGVLALDKAMINLSRSSVYKSNGVVDAFNSLASQYREEVVGQWFSLLTRLDVAIGRPVSTARKLITDFFTRPESPNQP